VVTAVPSAASAHTVQFYEGEGFLHRALDAFFAEAVRRREPAVMIARRRTFESVAERLAVTVDLSPADAAARVRFVDAHAALDGIMDGSSPDPDRFVRSFATLLGDCQRQGGTSTVWIYGEMVDILCRDGNHAAAIRLEELWNQASAHETCSVLCGYALEGFDADVNATQFRAVCRQHTHVIPAEGFSDAPDERTKLEQVALLQQRARALGAVLAPAPRASIHTQAGTATVYVVDDDESVRRSLARLLSSADLDVGTFASAEAFLAGVDPASAGCLVLDVQLAGMRGSDLLRSMALGNWRMPIIAMSASADPAVGEEALRLGARDFLRKPFDADALIDAIRRAVLKI
jgi:CheY-like chemotaxis protein